MIIGYREIAALLLNAGPAPMDLSPVDGLVAVVLAGEPSAVDRAALRTSGV